VYTKTLFPMSSAPAVRTPPENEGKSNFIVRSVY
jgi:hypothetical protein